MSPCCIYGCVAKTGIKQVKGTGSFYCDKHYPKDNTNHASAGSPNPKGKH